MARSALALAATGVMGAAAAAQPLPLEVHARDLTPDFSWGYRVGVKQPLGSVSHRRAVHQVSHRVVDQVGSPDYLVWIDDRAGTAELIERPVGGYEDGVINPGGMAVFQSKPGDESEVDRLWLVYGGRAHDLPFDLLRSQTAADPLAWETQLEDFVTRQGSTAPCLHAVGNRLFHAYRDGWSNSSSVSVRAELYDSGALPPTQISAQDLGVATTHPQWGLIGIEQLWTRYDPRFDTLLATWQWFRTDFHRFGANPVLLSTDRGETWQAVDGSRPDLPLTYHDNTPVLAPYDHLASDEDTGWYVRDLGLAPDGTPWTTLPVGDAKVPGGSWIHFWRWSGEAWEETRMTEGMHDRAKAHACGATRDFLVFVWSRETAREFLYLKYSRDNGATWEGPVLIDAVPRGQPHQTRSIAWVSYFQPADRYADNTARFLIGYYRDGDAAGRNYRNKLRYVSVRIGLRSDRNADGIANTSDFLLYLNDFASGSMEGDFDDDGTTNTLDFLSYLNTWTIERG